MDSLLPDENPISRALILAASSSFDVFVFVEGLTDQSFLSNMHRTKKRTNFINAHGKKNVISVLTALSAANDVYGVCDSDSDQLLGNQLVLPRLFYTDRNDLEMDALERGTYKDSNVLLLNENKRIKLGIGKICELALKGSMPLGALRYFNRSIKGNLKFASFKYGKKCLTASLQPDIKEICKIVINQNETNTLFKSCRTKNEKVSMLEKKAKDILTQNHNSYDLVNGHDFCEFYSIIFNLLKKNNCQQSKLNVR